MRETYAARARLGALMLDRLDPGWAGRIDNDLLDMNNTRRCILGQAYEHLASGISGYGWASDWVGARTGWAGVQARLFRCGFDGHLAILGYIEDQWKVEIAARNAA